MQLKHRFVDDIPETLEGGVLYTSLQHRTTIHKCCCGCGNEVVLPLDPAEWKLTFDGESVSMHPSVGNWRLPCRSHYWIRRGHIQWAEQWSEAQIAAGQAAEQRRRSVRMPSTYEAVVSKPPKEPSLFEHLRSIWRKLIG